MPRFRTSPAKVEARKARREQIIQLYNDGWTLRQIGEHFRCTHQAVHGILQRAGVRLRPRGLEQGVQHRR